RRFAGDIRLQQNRHRLAPLFGGLIDFLGNSQAIDTFDHLKKVDRITTFVGLEVADHVPMEMARTKRNFGPGFLDFAFAEKSVSPISPSAHSFRWMPFADGHEPDLGTMSIRAGARGLNPPSAVLSVSLEV